MYRCDKDTPDIESSSYLMKSLRMIYKFPYVDADAPSPRSMRCERLEAEGSVRSLYLWCDARGKATCLIGPLQSHWAGSGGNGLRAHSGALWAGGDVTGD